VVCGSNRACIVEVARQDCRQSHHRDRWHCAIVDRADARWAAAHQAHIADAGPSGPWLRVAVCEESGRNDPTFGYLGILPSTWAAETGEVDSTAASASWAQQVAVAEEIEAHAGMAGFVPDQGGVCGDW
jgi:hypothetical protein